MSNLQATAYLDKIFIYPIKSLDGISINQTNFVKDGGLKYDRQWAIFDENNKVVNGKRNPKIYQLRTLLDQELNKITFQIQGREEQVKFNLKTEKQELETWLSHYFGFSVHLEENRITGFPDDKKRPGPTIISTATLKTIADWFPNITVTEIRRRLRANLEIDGVPNFWEDQLFASTNQGVTFRIGEVFFQGIKSCPRCLVPTKDSYTGEKTDKFQQTFIMKRQETLPAWVNVSQFDHLYSASVNTKVPVSEVDKCLKVGDKIEIISVE